MASHSQSVSGSGGSDTPAAPSRITIGIRGAVAGLQANLMRTLSLRPVDKEFRIKGDSAARLGVELDHPAVDPLGIKLRVDGAVKRIGEIDPSPVSTHFDHLRTAAEPAVLGAILGARMARARDDAADAHLAGELGVEWIGYIVLLQIAGAPAGDIQEAIIHRKIDIGNQ